MAQHKIETDFAMLAPGVEVALIGNDLIIIAKLDTPKDARPSSTGKTKLLQSARMSFDGKTIQLNVTVPI